MSATPRSMPIRRWRRRTWCVRSSQRGTRTISSASSAHLHPEVFYHNVPVDPIVGREAVRAYLFGKGGFEWVDWKLLAIAESGNKVLTERIDDFGIGGRDISLPLMGIFEIEDGLIRAWRDYFDLAMYRRQLEQPPRR